MSWKYVCSGLANSIRRLNYYLFFPAAACIIFVALLTCSDIVSRWFDKPFAGSVETSSIVLAAMVFLSWAHTQAVGGHISLDLVTDHLPHRSRAIVNVFTSFLGLFFMGLLAWQAIPFFLGAWLEGVHTDAWRIPLYPFKFLVFVGAFTICCQFILNIADSYHHIRGRSSGNST